MKSRGLALYLPAVLLLAVAAGATWWGLRLRRQRAEQRFQAAAQKVRTSYYNLPSPAEFQGWCSEFREASESLLSSRSLRSEALRERIYFHHLCLDPASLRAEMGIYKGETRSYSSKDPIFRMPQVLFDCWSVPGPDSVERTRIWKFAATAFPGAPLTDIDWHRPLLLQRFVAAKRLLHEPAKAEAELGAVLEYAPWFAQAWYLRGRVRLAQGNAAGALRDFQEAARLDPTRPEVFRWTAQALEAAGQPWLAKAEVRRALELAPDYPEAKEVEARLK